MKVLTKPLIFTNGTPRTVADSVWRGLCSPKGTFPRMAGRSADCALAFIRMRPDGTQALLFLQCMRIQFDAHGRAYTWSMSTLPLERECVLGPGARPEGKYTKYRQEPHYWFPDALELERMARALSPRTETSLKAELLRASMRPAHSAPPPFMVPDRPLERRAER